MIVPLSLVEETRSRFQQLKLRFYIQNFLNYLDFWKKEAMST